MKVAIVAYGSRGDVQPFIALARGLNSHGHACRVIGPKTHRQIAEAASVRYHDLDDRIATFFLTDKDVIAAQEEGASPSAIIRAYRKLRAELDACLPKILKQMEEAMIDKPDLVVQVYDELPFDQAHHLAEKMGVPWVLATLSPNFVVSSHHPSKMVPPGYCYPGWVNRASHLPRVLLRSVGRRHVRRWRREQLSLRTRWRQGNGMRLPGGGSAAVLHCWSPTLLPPAPDWPASALTTGFLFSDPPGKAGDWIAPREVEAFLNQGDPPICVGFGSVRGRNPGELGEQVAQAVRLGGRRAIVVRAGGSIDMPRDQSNILVIDEAPYSWLFTRVSAVVHGGGMGISAEALRAGIPQVCILPVTEAKTWADVFAQAGAAAPAIMQSEATGPWLDQTLARLLDDPQVTRRVRELGRQVRAEDGTLTAVRALETLHSAAPGGSRPPARDIAGRIASR